MNRSITWTPAMDATLRRMREAGAGFVEIGTALGIGKTAAMNRAHHLQIAIGRRQTTAPEHRGEAPLRAGHPLSWGAISNQPWPAGGAA